LQAFWAAPVAIASLSLLAAGITLAPPRLSKRQSAASSRQALAEFSNLPSHFELLTRELPQTAAGPAGQPRFVARGSRGAVSLDVDAITLHLRGSGSAASTTPTASVRMTLPGANPGIEPAGVDLLPGRTHLLIGDDTARWRRDIPHFAKVRYRGVYEGIDLLFYGNAAGLEYDFEVAAGADPRIIRLAFEGARRMSIDERGDLVLETPAGPLRHRRPRAYQQVHGAQRDVRVAYDLDSSNNVRFHVGEYDRRRPLVIDPVLVYATYLGGAGAELGQSIAVDTEGCAYITGQVSSPDFPRTPGFPAPAHLDGATSYAFVTKLNPGGTQILYSIVLGGGDYDIGNAIAVDDTGAAYVVGDTRSDDFPVTALAAQRRLGGGQDAFAAKLSPDGSTLEYATYLGGGELEMGAAIATGPDGSAYIAGVTFSENFPTTPNAYQREHASGQDVFATKLSANGGRLAYSTLIGGSGSDNCSGIAVDGSGNVYLAGSAPSRPLNSTPDAYCLKLNSTGSGVVYLKLFGGSSAEEAASVAVDGAGNAYLTGVTFSKDFPTTAGVFQRESRSPPSQFGSRVGYDAFVVKIEPQGKDLVFSSLLNGTASSYGRTIGLDPQGNVMVAGFTASEDFPVTAGALALPEEGVQYSGFLAKLDPAARELLYATRLGGSHEDRALGMALDGSGDAYITGFTASADFASTGGAFQPGLAGSPEAFIARFSFDGPPLLTAAGVVSAASFLPGAIAPGMIVTIFGSGLGPPAGVSLQLDSSGLVGTQLQGTRVLFNDVPAPLIYASPHQVSAVAPYAFGNESSVRVVVECQGVRSAPVELAVAPSAPGLFTYDSSGSGPGAILNEDGSLNEAGNPAARGSIIVLYGTGEGQTEPAGQDGKIASGDPPRPRLPVSVLIAGRQADVIYAGGAPELVAGVIQVNARIPADLAETGELPVTLQVGGASSQPGVTLAVR
jgi:uncharacterized protein (TIGR03437 family)